MASVTRYLKVGGTLMAGSVAAAYAARFAADKSQNMRLGIFAASVFGALNTSGFLRTVMTVVAGTQAASAVSWVSSKTGFSLPALGPGGNGGRTR